MGKDPSEIRQEIELARRRMGETVEAIVYKTDVAARMKRWARTNVVRIQTAMTNARGRLPDRS